MSDHFLKTFSMFCYVGICFYFFVRTKREIATNANCNRSQIAKQHSLNIVIEHKSKYVLFGRFKTLILFSVGNFLLKTAFVIQKHHLKKKLTFQRNVDISHMLCFESNSRAYRLKSIPLWIINDNLFWESRRKIKRRNGERVREREEQKVGWKCTSFIFRFWNLFCLHWKAGRIEACDYCLCIFICIDFSGIYFIRSFAPGNIVRCYLLLLNGNDRADQILQMNKLSIILIRKKEHCKSNWFSMNEACKMWQLKDNLNWISEYEKRIEVEKECTHTLPPEKSIK